MFLSLIRTRRSIRRFEPRAVEPEKVEALLEVALRSPSSMGTNPWSFLVVTDPGILEALSKAKPLGAAFLKGAPMAVVVLADPAKSSVWIEDASIATLLLHLAAHALGLGSCWIQIRDRMHDDQQSADSYIRGLLGIPENLAVEAMVAVGYPAEKKPPHAAETLQWEKVFVGRYGQPYRAT